MKKIFCLAIVAFAALSSTFGQTVSESEARTLSAALLQKNAQFTNAAPEEMETVTIARLKNGAPAYYVMQPAAGEGYVILSANRASQPLLGFSSTSSFDPQNIPPALQYMLDIYKAQLEAITTQRLTATPEIGQAWQRLSGNLQTDNPPVVIVQPLLQTTWDQRPQYNNLCPNGGSLSGQSAPTGCVATAMAQLMYYWSFPITNQTVNVEDKDIDNTDGISGTFKSDVGGGYHWGNMSLHLIPTSTPLQIAEIANLMFDCGVAAKMDYGVNESDAYAVDAASAMDNLFGYTNCTVYSKSNFSTLSWLSKLKNNLNQGIPMYYGGDNAPAPAGQNVTGHAWVIDGYRDDNQFHMNWGWGGTANGYFPLGALNPTLSDGTMLTLTNHQHMFSPVPDGGCTPFAVLSGVQTNFSVEVAHWISASSTLPPLPGVTVVFNAHDDILLTDGFTAVQGTDFHAFIQGCNGFASDADDRSVEQETIEAAVPVGTVQIAPNPFSGSTTIRYALSGEAQVAMQLMDATGKLVATPMQAETQSQGEHQFNLEAGSLPSGMYFLLLQMGDKQETKRVILSR